jgi:WD40 repeat protein
MFLSLAAGASLGYFIGGTLSPPMPRTVTETATATQVITSTTTTTGIPTLGSEELSGVLLVNTLDAVYRLDMSSSANPHWELFVNESIRAEQISPDGRYFVYDIPKSGIYIFDGNSSTLLKREESPISCLSWSPDSSKLAYMSHSSYVLELTGKTRLIDTPRTAPSYKAPSNPLIVGDVRAEFGCPVWTGANTLLYQRFQGSWPEHVNVTCSGLLGPCWGTIPADTTTVATLTSGGVTLRNLPQRWFVEKASSNTLLLRDKEHGGRLYMVGSLDLASGKMPAPLPLCETSECREAYFSPDGSRIVFIVESAQGETSLALVDVDTLETRTVPLGIRYISDVAWSPNGREIIVRENDLISTLDLQTQMERRILAGSPSLLMWRTAWSRNGDYMAVLAVPPVGGPKAAKEVLCIIRVTDSAYYLLPQLPEGSQNPEILCWLGGSS